MEFKTAILTIFTLAAVVLRVTFGTIITKME